jgi:plastocyanin
MRKVLVPLLSLALLGAIAATALAATKSVKVGDNYFVKSSGVPTVSIRKGDRLKFNFAGSRMHNAVGVGISLGSSCKKFRDHGSCTSSVLKKKGTFTIYCAVHGKSDQSMKVRIR